MNCLDESIMKKWQNNILVVFIFKEYLPIFELRFDCFDTYNENQ